MSEVSSGVTISYEDKEVLANGSIITFGSGPTNFAFAVGGDRLNLIVEYSGDETSFDKQRIETKVQQPDTLHLHFINYNNALGTFTREPQFLGTIAGRRFWFSYVIVALKESKSKLLSYTFYVEKESARAQD